MAAPGANLTKWYPQIPESVPQDVALQLRLLYDGINDHDQAITTQQSQLGNLNSMVTAAAAAGTSTASTVTVTQIVGFANLGVVNDQTGQIAYTVQGTDSGSLVVLNDASPIAVTLNSAVVIPYFVFIANQGTGAATLIASSGVINGLSAIPGNSSAMVFFDGSNWWTWAIRIPQSALSVAHQWLKSYSAATGTFTQTQPDYSDLTGRPTLPATFAPVANSFLTSYNASTGFFSAAQPAYSGLSGLPVLASTYTAPAHQWVTAYDAATGLFTSSQPAYSDLTGLPILPATAAPVASQWIASYDATTGAFSQSQPAFSDISGEITTAQLPTAGVSGTIPLGPLTVGGTTGSITVTNGIITAFTAPT